MKQTSCNVIRDLLPSYVDKLTSEDSNRLVEEHIAECKDCAGVLNDMQRAADEAPIPGKADKKEIDFLKKNKRRNLRIAIYCVIGAIAGVFLILFIRAFGTGMSRLDARNWAVEKITVEDGVIHFKATAMDSISVIKNITVEEGRQIIPEDGAVLIMPRIVLSGGPFRTKNKEFTYQLTDPSSLKRIYFGNRVIWADGEVISENVNGVYDLRHKYVGNASMNVQLANGLHARELFGTFENKLETEKEPYGWILQLKNEIPERERILKEGAMTSIAYVSLGLIGNLDHVTFEYVVDGEAKSFTVNVSDATEFLGEDVKNCYENPRVLKTLMVKLGLE